jgi:transposase-like protein
MANRKRTIDEKVKSVQIALEQINIEEAAREAGVPASTLRYDLSKVKQSLVDILKNGTPGPKPRSLPPSGSSPTE